MTIGDLVRDVKLVRNQINPAAEESAHWRFARGVKQFQRAATERKLYRGVKATGKETFLRASQTRGRSVALRVNAPNSRHTSATLLFDHFPDDELALRQRLHFLAGSKAHPTATAPEPWHTLRFTCCRKLHLHPLCSRMHNRGQSELWLRLTDPSLADDVHRQNLRSPVQEFEPAISVEHKSE